MPEARARKPHHGRALAVRAQSSHHTTEGPQQGDTSARCDCDVAPGRSHAREYGCHEQQNHRYAAEADAKPDEKPVEQRFGESERASPASRGKGRAQRDHDGWYAAHP
jgi:hypothetical protein